MAMKTQGNTADPHSYYEYNHGTGRHILVRPDPDVHRPKYSLHCILCNLIDVLVFVGCLAFLFFSVRYALSLLDDNGD